MIVKEVVEGFRARTVVVISEQGKTRSAQSSLRRKTICKYDSEENEEVIWLVLPRGGTHCEDKKKKTLPEKND